MYFSETDIRQVTESVWTLVLHMPAEESHSVPLPQGTAPMVSGSVHLTGSWNGTVTVCCQEELARNAAAVMYGTPAEVLPVTDVYDAMGELANMIGGNVRALLPEPCQLSLPEVRPGRLAVPVPQHLLFDLTFVCLGKPFWVQLHGV